MNSKFAIGLIQLPLYWESPEKNRKAIEGYLERLKQPLDLVLLPEMFTSGFTMHPQTVAESMEGPTILWMQNWAKQINAALGGSLAIKEGALFYNRFVIATPSGALYFYDKRHTFTLAGEDKVYKKGTHNGLFKYKGWTLCMRICYDLRFPVWSRNTHNYDILLYVANWPKPRIKAWDTLLQARAIENLSYVVGVNRIGSDANKHSYPGHSAVYDPLGNQLSPACSSEEGIIRAELDFQYLQAQRKQLRFLEDQDSFELY
jgi:omega-amidase